MKIFHWLLWTKLDIWLYFSFLLKLCLKQGARYCLYAAEFTKDIFGRGFPQNVRHQNGKSLWLPWVNLKDASHGFEKMKGRRKGRKGEEEKDQCYQQRSAEKKWTREN